MVMLIDADSFFCSCERVFQPSLRGKPLVVLSSNDGNIISRTSEAKKLGIKMGVPLFEVRDFLKRNGVEIRSSNYSLYGDLSDRLMKVVQSFIQDVEPYSIDEAFCDLSGYQVNQVEPLAHRIRDTIQRWVGIPVSIGIAPTKVLAKVASKVAKKGAGVVALTDPERISNVLADFPVGDLWGIGRRYNLRLDALGVKTALEFRAMPAAWVKKYMTVNGERIILELKGISCIPVELFKPDRKAIGSAKSFGTSVESLSELKEGLTAYLSTCAVKMRKQGSAASILSVFLQTNFFKKGEPQYSNFRSLNLPTSTDLTPVLLKYAVHALTGIYRPGYKYKRVGIILSGFVPAENVQQDAFDSVDKSKLRSLQRTMDKINLKHDHGTVRFASQGFSLRWAAKDVYRSPRFTTRFEEILTVSV